MACVVIIEKFNAPIVVCVSQQIFTTLKIITQPNMYTTTSILKLYTLK